MSWWDWFWGHWWPTIDWGNAAGWVGSILSSGSLVLALVILARDRDEKRKASANKLSTWWKLTTLDPVDDDDISENFNWVLSVYAFNSNDAPLPYITISGVVPSENNAKQVEWFNERPDGSPGVIERDKTYVVRMPFCARPSMGDLCLAFTDTSGRYWVRKMLNGKYLSPRARKNFVKES